MENQNNSDYKLLNTVIDLMPNLVIVLDEDLNIVDANQQFLSIFKLTRAEIDNKHFTEYFDTFSFSNAIDMFIKSTDTELVLYNQLLVNRELKNYKFILKKYATDTHGIIIYGEDHTKQQEINNELNAYKHKSLQFSKLSLLSDVFSGLSLEIEAPAIIILSSLKKVQKIIAEKIPEDADEINQKLQRVNKNVNKVFKLIKNIEAFSKEQADAPNENLLVTDLISKSLDLCHERLKQHEIHLIIEQIDPNLRVDCNSNLIAQIILNLVSNSEKALLHQEEKWIKISAADAGDYIRFKVTDAGKGIDAKMAEQIFSDKATISENGPATGLMAAKNIIEGHFGKIYLDEQNAHTCFIFDIPK